ncbi:MAG: DUF4185 domain-containing protein [Acidobacteriaceae bacterium]
MFFLILVSYCSGQTVPRSTFFSTAAEESYSTYQLPGDGDLWPSCWAADGNLYAANGDGMAFDPYTKPLDFNKRYDMAVSRISGMPPHLSGKTIARDVGTDWSGPNYNRKPTGMLCIHGAIYLAFQNLVKHHFNDAPAASIAKSTDHGQTWTWDKSKPMFGTPDDPNSPEASMFTTIFFADFGKDSDNAIDRYVYVYGLDHNWAGQQELYLARVPDTKVQNRSTWEFYAGTDEGGSPQWTKDITEKQPVLEDHRRLYPNGSAGRCASRQPVIGQGGVVYDKPLRRFLFTSWSCATHQMYEAPEPWGPWKLFLSKDFGPFFTPRNYGMYGTSIPSKFISADGKTLYLQSNIWWTNHGKSVWRAYTFALRKVYLEPFYRAAPSNRHSGANLALAPGARAVSKSTHFGSLCGLNCSDSIAEGASSGSEDDFDGSPKKSDWWGYQWPRAYNFNEIAYETGKIFPDGGWYAAIPRVQVYQNFHWVDVAGVSVKPSYPSSAAAGDHQVYVFRFPKTLGYGVRIIGVPGGPGHYTSIARLAVYYRSGEEH